MAALLQDRLELQPEQRREMINLRTHFLQSLAECHEARQAICLGLQKVSYALWQAAATYACSLSPWAAQSGAGAFMHGLIEVHSCPESSSALLALCSTDTCACAGYTEGSDCIFHH